MPKLKWQVGEKPTGRYRSFQPRSWPSCSYVEDGMSSAGYLVAVDRSSYHPVSAETTELRVYVACRDQDPVRFTNRRLSKSFMGVKAAKQALENFLAKHPEHWPLGLRP